MDGLLLHNHQGRSKGAASLASEQPSPAPAKRANKGEEAMRRPVFTLAAWTLALGWSVGLAAAEKAYGPGVTDSEIKLGANAPYSGPASIYASFPKTMIAYFAMLNEKGGINGRKIDFVTRDDAYS